MSTPTTITSRFPFEPHIKDMPPQQQYVIRNLWNVAFDAQNAISILKPQIDANKSAVTAVTKTVNNNTTSQTVIQQITSAFGTINNQSGNTTYATQQSDASAFIILSDASPVAVSLTGTPVITLPWACTILNFGAGTATLTPASGTITYSGNVAAASLVLPQYFAASIAFDGTNFWGAIIQIAPQTIAAVTSKWLNSYSATTGLFTSTQPAFTDISGNLATSQLPTVGISATITTAKLTVGGTNGSQTFTNGILTAQVQAT